MNVSVRSYLMAGAAAATATTLALTSVQMTPEDIAVPAHPVSAQQPELSEAMVDLLAAASRLTSALPLPTPPTGVVPAPPPPGGPAPTAIAIAPNLANTIDQIYLWVEPWVRYGFELGAYALGWVPWVGGYAGGLLMDGYNFGQSLVASGVFNFTDWLRGNGGIVTNLVDFGVDVGLAFVWLGIDVASTFIPLPPLPLPPRPPLQGPFLAANLATTTLAAPSVASIPSVIGDIFLPPVDFATNAFTSGFDGLLDVSQAVTGGTLAAIDPVLDRLGLDFVNDQLNINYDLLNRLSIEEVGLVNDLVSVPDNYLTDVLRNGEGPLRTLGTQAEAVVDSVVSHGSASVDALGDYVRDQVDFFTPGLAATDADTAEVTRVPATVKASLDTETTETKDTTDTKPVRSLAKNVGDAVDKAAAGVKADVKKVSDNVRQAVRDARDNAGATKTDKAEKADQASETKAEKKSEKKTEKKAQSEKSDKE